MIGQTISHYRIVEAIGAGGMGMVYRAEDMRLRRVVALKFLPIEATQDREARDRLIAEAQTASALDHPNICTIYEIDETPDGRMFLAMSYYEGETLKARIGRGPMPIDEALDVVAQVARAVAAAHDAGVIHRDIKPANIMLVRRGEVKLLDFGIAKLTGRTALTRTGITVGTLAYMSPERFAGHGGDEISDVWALGVVLYEMIAGRLPFAAEHDVGMIAAIVNAAPVPLSNVRTDVSPDVERTVRRALDKTRDARYQTAHEFLHAVESLRSNRTAVAAIEAAARPAARTWSHRALAATAAAVLVVGAAAGWFVYRGTRTDRLRQETLPRIVALQKDEQFAAAYRLFRSVEQALAGDPELEKVREAVLVTATVRTSPPGADVYVKGYGEIKDDWLYLGRSPLENIRAPFGYFRYRALKDGHSTFEGAGPLGMAEITMTLQPAGTLPAGMVFVPGSTIPIREVGPTQLPSFYFDTYEVTNREYKKFIDAGGYRSREYWTEPFIRDSQEISWDEGLRDLRDSTGRSGPSTWELGAYPHGQDDFPVRGVSWYEAAAYAKYAGKALPTVYHWRRAASAGSVFSDILEHSNFSATGPAAVGTYKGIGEYGTYDMAGNVKEWTRNAVGDKRYILGGAWNEPNYKFASTDALMPFDRAATNGFRCMMVTAKTTVSEAFERPIPIIVRDYTREKPVSDDVFKIYRGLYAYDRADLKAVVHSTDDSSEFWRTERISYAAAFGNERIVAYLFLPKNAKPPYQTVVYFPHSGGEFLRSFQQSEMNYLGFVVKGGRALLFPMYKGTYERRLDRPPQGLNALRELTIQRMLDLQRSVDYIETRPDLDRSRLAFFGVSLGGRLGAIALAIEQRFAAAVLWSGGFRGGTTLPEIDELNFAPRVRTPVLMLNGRDDFTFPIETSQLPMFRSLGTPDADKRHVLYDGGHVFPFARIMKDSLDWLDRYLGAIR
jgi:formylglycine-generating enzyme required for sulfatase activity/dienelactone hydrolase